MNQQKEPPHSEQDRVQIEALATKYAAAANKGDVAGITALFTEDGVFVTPPGILKGREAIGKLYQDLFKDGAPSSTVITTADVHIAGTVAWAFGQWRNNIEHGNWGAVDERYGDTWSIRMLTTNVTPPTAEG